MITNTILNASLDALISTYDKFKATWRADISTSHESEFGLISGASRNGIDQMP